MTAVTTPAQGYIHPDLRITPEDIRQALNASDDPRTQVAAFIVSPLEGHILARGSNIFSHYLLHQDERCQAPGKYGWLMHAEARAIANAAKRGVRLEDARIYVTSSPCLNCANLIIAAGIDTVYVPAVQPVMSGRWNESIDNAYQAFKEAGVEYKVIN